MDARQLRTRARLARAILYLAAVKAVADITVSEIATTAQINRSTFYEHSDSPTALLRATLRDELDDIRDRNLAHPTDVAASVRAVTLDVLSHVDAHAAIYSRALGHDESGELHSMLSSHFERSVRLLVDDGSVEMPEGATEFTRATAARFIADGTVGAIDVWLHTPAPRSADEFLASYRTVMPAWWPLG